jgi:hypothetical protein
LGAALFCTTTRFAQKRNPKPVGGRGISAFSDDFFEPGNFSGFGVPTAGHELFA